MPLPSRLLRSLALAIPLCAAQPLAAAQAGDADAGYGDGGIVRIDGGEPGMVRLGARIDVVKTLPDGRSLGAGQMAGRAFVARWLADGSVDATFGDGGTRVLAGPELEAGLTYRIASVEILGDGRILVAGEMSRDAGTGFLVWRIESSGAVDRTWNRGRPRILDTDPVATAIAAFPSADGSVMAVGSTGSSPSDFNRALSTWRIASDGTLDAGHGTGGVRKTTVTSSEFGGADMQADGRIVVVGSGNLGNDDALLVARLTPTGALDTTFNGSGAFRTTFPTTNPLSESNSRTGHAVAVRPDGRIVVAGRWNYSSNDTKYQSALVGITATGALDTGFGSLATPGVVPLPHASYDEALDLLLLGDGRIVATGYALPNGWVARFTADGRTKQFETSITGLNGTGRRFESLATLPDGSYLLGGYLETADVARPLRVRVTATGARDQSFAGTSDGLAVGIAHRTADTATALAVDGVGRAVVGYGARTTGDQNYRLAYAGLARITAAGGADTAFSGDGRTRWRTSDLVETTNPMLEQTRDLAIDGSGRILAAGFTDTVSGGGGRCALARFLSDGSLDTGFGTGGRILSAFGVGGSLGSMEIRMVVQADGRPVTLMAANTGNPNILRLTRYTTAGAVDTGFGTNGTVDLLAKFGFSTRMSLALLPDGRLLVAGRPTGGTTDLQTGRLLANGAWDASYDGDGVAAVELGTAFFVPIRIVPLSGDRSLAIVARVASGAETGDHLVVGLTAAGALDPAFGGAGVLAYNPGPGDDRLADIDAAGGRLLFVGTEDATGVDPRIRLSAHLAGGAADTTFGEDGAVVVGSGIAADMAIQSDGRILVAASRDGDVVVHRLLSADDAAPIAILADTPAVDVPEDGTATIGVRLGSAPAGPVTVNATISGDPDLRVTGGAVLTFTPADWQVLQVVRIGAAKDADLTDGTATLTLAGTGLAGDSVAVREIDDRLSPAQISAVSEQVTVPEGGSASVGVRLTAAPTGTVTVSASLQPGGDPDLAITGGASLVFGPADWNTAKPVTLSAAPDADAANGTAVLRLTSPGLVEVQVLATEGDAGTPPVATILSTRPAGEGGSAGSFTIGISRAMPGPTTVGFVVDAGGGSAEAGDVVFAPVSPITIAAGQVSATVAVTAVADGLVEGNERLRIALVTGTGYTLPQGGSAADVDIVDAGGPVTNAAPYISVPAAAGPGDLALP